ncbi:hypothetical protein K490DRAFT_59167 [Saccharata proteae CBS 121410]|uniref:PH domain-containing protein n=1 Tax=Saccharata proteae CBS 121410 TaxID=1314787 RepID=A0A9P4LUN1_9PEZI|nr:hypothetical protein K490DRAFT_59167 [Saccharata proteae CBS 121410]
MSSAKEQVRVLLLTANPASESASWIKKIEDYSHDLLAALRKVGAQTELFSFQDTKATPEAISSYTHVLFLTCDKYNLHVSAFNHLLEETLPTACSLNPSLHIHNPVGLTLWNCNKTYLQDLRAAGFMVPETTFYQPPALLDTPTTFLADFQSFLRMNFPSDAALVLKPSIAASGLSTHLLRTPHSLSDNDAAVLQSLCDGAPPGSSFMIQEFMSAIQSPSGGEWSLIYVAGQLTHAVLKEPRAGEFRINSAFGGVWTPMEANDERVPQDARHTAEKLWRWLLEKEREERVNHDPVDKSEMQQDMIKGDDLLYARIDGVSQ